MKKEKTVEKKTTTTKKKKGKLMMTMTMMMMMIMKTRHTVLSVIPKDWCCTELYACSYPWVMSTMFAPVTMAVIVLSFLEGSWGAFWR